MRPNWFIAFPIAGSFVVDLPAVPASFRLVSPADVHLTLSWLGGCAPATAERAFGLLDEHLKAISVPAIRASLGEVVPMGGSGRSYTALSALLSRGRSEVEQVITGLGSVPLMVLKKRRTRGPATPHVTLARPPRRANDTQREAGLAWANALDLRSVNVALDRVALYTWSQNRRERLFRIVAERGLGS